MAVIRRTEHSQICPKRKLFCQKRWYSLISVYLCIILIYIYMSALSVLYLVLPLPLAFILHDTEEAIVQHRWMLKHKDALAGRFPGMKSVIDYLCGISTKSFVIAVLEELVVLLLATCYVLVQGEYSFQIWAALFMAFSFHLVVHVLQAVMVKGYVPGVVSSLLLIPYAYVGLEGIWYAMSGMEMVICGVVGIIFMVANLLFAHRIAGMVIRSRHE